MRQSSVSDSESTAKSDNAQRTSSRETDKKHSVSSNAGKSFSSWMESFSSDNRSAAPNREKAAGTTSRKDSTPAPKESVAQAPAASKTSQPVISSGTETPASESVADTGEPTAKLDSKTEVVVSSPAIPIQVQILPLPVPLAASMTAQVGLGMATPTLVDSASLGASSAPDVTALAETPSLNAADPQVSDLSRTATFKIATKAHVSQNPISVFESLFNPSITPTNVPLVSTQSLPEVSLKTGEQATRQPELADPNRPAIQDKLDGMDDRNSVKIPSWLESSLSVQSDSASDRTQAQTRPGAKVADTSEVAFTATIKEAGQPAKQQSNGGKSGQQDSSNHDRTAGETVQPNQTISPGGQEKVASQLQFASKPIVASKPGDSVAVLETPKDQPVVTRPMTSISLKVDSPTSPGVDVRLTERGGTIQVSVRTPDRELTGDIRERLNELVDNLSGKGYETQTWTPDAGISDVKRSNQLNDLPNAESSLQPRHSVSSTFQAQNESRNFSQGDSEKGGGSDDSSSGRQSKGDGRESGQQNGRQRGQGQSIDRRPKNIFRTILEGARP